MEPVFSPGITACLIGCFILVLPVLRETFPTLIEREREMLHLKAQRTSNAELPGSYP